MTGCSGCRWAQRPAHSAFGAKKADGWKRVTLDVAPRSTYLMAGPARQEWEHSIPPVDAPRTSITFRTMAERNAKA